MATFKASNISVYEFMGVIKWFNNHGGKDEFRKIWGNVMGDHFWGKWDGRAREDGADTATISLICSMSDHYIEDLFRYLEGIEWEL